MVEEYALMRRAWGQSLEPTLSQRIIGIGNHPYRWFTHLVFIRLGTVRLGAGDTAGVLQGPCLLLLPSSELVRLRLSAGSCGHVIGAAMDIIGDAIGDYPESKPIRLFITTKTIMTGLLPQQASALESHMRGLIDELNRDGQPSHMVVSAYLRLLINWAWRHTMPSGPAASLSSGGAAPILHQFRQLVEADYRHHRPVADYAARLGISTDRLHALCRKHLGRAPIELVHERLAQEGRIRLERSDSSARDISEALGFRDPAHFSHFFKRKTGLSPAAYRRMVRQSSVNPVLGTNMDYHDWP
ncbi:helix-turn-helix transcriptional regulator [Agrobacterium vitis]